MNKIQLQIIRFAQTPKTTLGQLFVVDPAIQRPRFIAYTIEDTLRKEKIKKETAIFAGLHQLRMRKEGRIYTDYVADKMPVEHGLIEILSPQFQFTMIHKGINHVHTEGCPLVTIDYTIVEGEFVGKNSKDAFVRLMTVPFTGLSIPEHIAKYGGEVVITNHPRLEIK